RKPVYPAARRPTAVPKITPYGVGAPSPSPTPAGPTPGASTPAAPGVTPSPGGSYPNNLRTGVDPGRWQRPIGPSSMIVPGAVAASITVNIDHNQSNQSGRDFIVVNID